MQWFRWYHGTCADPKMGSVARRAGTTRERVIAVWAMLLESASENDVRGRVGIDAEGMADCLGCETESVLAVLTAMQGRGMLGEGMVTNWEPRQSPSNSSTERVRRHRARLSGDETRSVTHETVTVTPPEVDRDLELEKETDSSVLKLNAGGEDSISAIMIAANRGMMENPLIGDACHPIPVSHSSRQDVADWLADGVPAELARSVVYARAREWKPEGRRRQITTLKYFDGPVRDALDKHRASTSEKPNGSKRLPRDGGSEPKAGGKAPRARGRLAAFSEDSDDTGGPDETVRLRAG